MFILKAAFLDCPESDITIAGNGRSIWQVFWILKEKCEDKENVFVTVVDEIGGTIDPRKGITMQTMTDKSGGIRWNRKDT